MSQRASPCNSPPRYFAGDDSQWPTYLPSCSPPGPPPPSPASVTAKQYRDAIDARGQLIAGRRGATTAVDVPLNRARKLADTLSVLVSRALPDDPASLAEWNQLKRVGRRGVRQTTGEDAGQPAAPAATPQTSGAATPVTASVIAEPVPPEQVKVA
jgi:hypothetical protein